MKEGDHSLFCSTILSFQDYSWSNKKGAIPCGYVPFLFKNPVQADFKAARYFGGMTASLKALAMRIFTTVLAGILISSPVAGFLPILAFRF